MTKYFGTLTVAGAANKKKPVNFYLGDLAGLDEGINMLAATTQLGNIATALEPIITGTIVEQSIRAIVDTDVNALTGDEFERASVVVYLSTEAGKRGRISFPTPAQGIFQSATGPTKDTIDVNDADLQAYIDAIAANAEISDGEIVDTAQGVNGMEAGRRVTVNV